VSAGTGVEFASNRELLAWGGLAVSVELATIWLVDLVGSTRLASSVGPVRADELRDEYFALLREAIGASDGKEFKNTGDGLFVAFASASAAVSCAVLTQQLFERRYRGAEQQLHVRIGLGTGEATVTDGDYFGMPSIEAARLCEQASVDGILVSLTTKLLAGRVDGARFESAGVLELKGIPEPMEAFTIGWEALDPERSGSEVGRWPLPEALRTEPRVAYVGRVTERRLLDHARNEARSGTRQVVLLSGEPGIGKTRLASYAALGANSDRFAVCWGACSEDLSAPYEPWIDVCSQLVEHADGDALAQYVERFGGEISRLASNLARRLPDAPMPQSSDPETERFLLFKAVPELLRMVAASAPLCVVLDDFHWADGQSVALLKHVAKSVEQGALQVLVTYRDSDLTKDHPLTGALADLRPIEGVQRIALTGLGADEVAELLASAAGHDLDADGLALAGELAGETGGNPFFVGEILRNLTESGAIAFDEATGRWSVDRSALSSLPESVRDVIERRIDRLDGARDVLTIAAVIGRSFDVALLVELVEMSEARLLDLLEAAVGASLLRESTDQVGRFTFEHALINHTMYQGLGNTRRARLHRQIAETLEQQLAGEPGARVGELAQHWAKATTAVDLDKAVTYTKLAGERALAELAPDEALQWFGRALELLGDRDDPATRCDLLIGLGEAQRLTGEVAHRQTLLDASRIASELADGERSARAALANSRGQTSAYGRVDEARVAGIERALELDDDPDRRARLLSLQAMELLYEHDHGHRRDLAEQALALAREIGTPRTTARVLCGWFRAFQAPDGLERRLAHRAELVAAVQAAGDPALEFWAASAERVTMVESGELERAEHVGERMVAISEGLGEPTMRWQVALSVRASMALLRGDLANAERWAEQTLQAAVDAGEPDGAMLYGAQVSFLRILQGRAGEVVAPIEQSANANPLIPAFKAAVAWALCWLGRADEAAAIVAEAARDGFEHVPWEQTRTAALAMYADAAAQAGVNDAAEILYELIEPWADQVIWNGVIACGHTRTYLGLLAAALGRDEQADEHFARAIDIQERDGMLVWAARAHLGWAEALAARGERERGYEHAASALELSRTHGYGFLEPRAAAILQARSPVG
jgi:class 3 adenylate cyclase